MSQSEIRAEEVITTYENPNNGSGPMWCFGCRTIVRHGENRVRGGAGDRAGTSSR